MADFVLGRLKFKWRGDWSTSTAYLIDDIVKYGGNTYVCVTNHTSAAAIADFYTDLNSNSYWQLHTEGLFFKSTWAQSTFYKLNDLVRYGAYLYRTTTQHTSTSSFDATKFEIYAEGLQWEDSYDAGTTYQKGDVVTYGGYAYVAAQTTVVGVTPVASANEWDLLSPGFSAQGDWDISTAYKTGDVVNYGGYAFVCIVNTTAGTTPQNTTFWTKIVEGINWTGTYNSSTTYQRGDAVLRGTSSYICIADDVNDVTPGTDATKWNLIAQGDTSAQLTNQGDIQYRDATGVTRLPIGIEGSVLTSNGLEPTWQSPESRNVLYVSNGGDDNNPGTQFLPFKSIYYALSQAGRGDVQEVNNIAGGTGGSSGTYNASATGGSGTGFSAQVVLDSSSVPTSITIINGGSNYVAGDTLTLPSAQIGSNTDITFDVVSVSVGDVVFVKNGVYSENLPLKVPTGVTVQGESLRGTEIRPAAGTGGQVATITSITGGTGGTPGTYNYVHQTSTSGSGDGIVLNIVTDGSSTPTITVYHGGYHYEASDTITIDSTDIGGATDITVTVASLENNNASNMFLLNDTTNVVQMTFKGLTGTPTAGGTSVAAVCSLDPEGSVTSASPYVQNCTSVNSNATGIQIDGNLHSSGNKSILANDFTQINSDGIGVHALARGRGEMVSVFTYYCAKSFYATDGGFIRGLNCSSAYGEEGAVADGTDPLEAPINIQTRGEMLKYDTSNFVGGATESDVQDMIATSGQGTATVTDDTSGATATVFRVNLSLDYLHIENRSGNFTQGGTVTITKEDSTTFQVGLDGSFGEGGNANSGQIGPLIAVKSGSQSLSSTNIIKVATNIKFVGDSKYYRISAVSEEDTSGETALVRLTESVGLSSPKAESTSTDITENFSNVRLTGHDFLDIGTGDFITTNYPGGPSQPADQADEVSETTGGRVYFTSSDQRGDFRVGDLFRVEQATGVATLNADAFDLSGLNELQLGSIGAELGATINEFSTDETLGGDANTAVPTERAVKGYLTRDQAGVGAWVPPTGTTAQRPTGGDLYTGAFRYNETLVTWEGYNGVQWTGLGGGNPWSTITGDGSTTFTVAANDRVFVDTSGGATTINLPASPQTGDSIRFLDLASTFDTNNLTVGRNGNNINGSAADLVVSTEDSAFGLVYSGATYGWKLVEVL